MKPLPNEIFSNHIAVLGKTGSGKTCTSKLIVEQVVKEKDARVCVLDPIKSDWWGLTLGADGKKAALPFRVLGGPYGHVPLHAAAGDAIGRVVASGALRHSIIDMADFMPGEHAKFFIAFAHSLFRNMTGVLYLVVEEAHMFAPKEKPGFGEEGKSTHWMTRIATGARSKGIRLIVCTQRVQSLHNAVLGSCETVIAQRLALPADQKPVVDWLTSNIGKSQAQIVASSISSLQTGEGWLCSAEANILDRRKFPMIATYDNSATPTGDAKGERVRPPAIDDASLKSLIGDAVKQAEDNDPVTLRRRIAELEKQLKGGSASGISEMEVAKRVAEARFKVEVDLNGKWVGSVTTFAQALHASIDMAAEKLIGQKPAPYQEALAAEKPKEWPKRLQEAKPLPISKKDPQPPTVTSATSVHLTKAAREILTAILQHDGHRAAATKVAYMAGYQPGGSSMRGALAELRKLSYIEGSEILSATAAGASAIPKINPLPTGMALVDVWRHKLTKASREILDVLLESYPRPLNQDEISKRCATPYEAGGSSMRGALAELRKLELATGRGDAITASSVFFEEGN